MITMAAVAAAPHATVPVPAVPVPAVSCGCATHQWHRSAALALAALPWLRTHRRCPRSLRRGSRDRFWQTLDFRSWTTEKQDPQEPLPKASCSPDITEAQVRRFSRVLPNMSLYFQKFSIYLQIAGLSTFAWGTYRILQIPIILVALWLWRPHFFPLQVREFEENGVVLLRGVIPEWVPWQDSTRCCLFVSEKDDRYRQK